MGMTMTSQSEGVTTGTQSGPESAWSEPRLQKFWQAMVELYGRRWKTEHGDAISEVWRREIMSITPDEAVMGWRVCRDSGDEYPCTLPQFMFRVKYALQRDKPAAPEHKPLPTPMPKSVQAVLADGAKAAAEKAARVDVNRLRKALGGKPIRPSWPRRVLLRGQTHPAKRFDLDDMMRMRAEARKAGRSLYDVDLELMAYNGWSPDEEEEEYDKLLQATRPQLRTPRDKDATPFLDAWRASAEK